MKAERLLERAAVASFLAVVSCSTPAPARETPAKNKDLSAFDPGPTVGETLPPFEALDQAGRRQTFETLRGPKGLLLNFNRSADW